MSSSDFFHREFIPTQSIKYKSRMIFLDMEWIQNIYFPSTLFKKNGISEGCTEVKKDSKPIQGRHKTQEATDESSEVLRQMPIVL